MKTGNKIDKPFLITILSLTVIGLIIFLSSSYSLLAKESASYASVLANHLGIGLLFGGLVAFVVSYIPYRFWSAQSFWMYLLGIVLLILVFIPGLGMSLGGARRWLNVFGLSFQPVEFMKLAYILFIASWFYAVKDKTADFKKGFISFIIISAIPALLMLMQPDIDNTIIMLSAGICIYFIAGAKLRHISSLIILGAVLGSIMIATHPYALQRIKTFFDPTADPRNTGYQINQSIIAVGAGQIYGKGLGQSIQKFQYLPEPMSDSIFAVYSEEFGFIGSSILLILYMCLLFFGARIAIKSKDSFGRLTATGIVILIVGQSFLNIASMLGLMPLSGLPLLFISQGGTALFFTLLEVGIVLNISKYQNK